MQTKTFALAEVKAIETDNPHGEFEVILSAPTLDRDGEVIDARAFEPLPDHITFDIDHGLSTATTVGSGSPYYEGDVLKVKGTFSSIPRAQEVRTLVTEGHIRTTSVAFMGAKKETKDGQPHITKAELLNGAFVPVPSNREAAVVMAKSIIDKAGARNSASDSERLQQIHDLAVDNGAVCAMKGVKKLEAKTAVAGSYEERQEELREALNDLHAADLARRLDYSYLCIVATFEDRVVYTLWIDGNDDATYQRPYSFDGDEVTLGDATPVEVEEVVTVAPAGDTRSTEAEATKDATGASEDDAEGIELRARAAQLSSAAFTA